MGPFSCPSHLFLLLTAASAALTHIDCQLAASQQPAASQPPFVVKFIGMQHDHANDTKAIEELAQAIQLTTKQDIQIDSLTRAATGDDRFDVTWHSRQLTSCSDEEASRLVETIQDQSRFTFTREFKMSLSEHFDYPHRVEIEWLGPCENLGRKRSRPQGEPDPVITANDGSNSRDDSQASSTTEASELTGPTQPASSSTTAEPTPPASTTEAPTTMPAQFTATEEEPTTTSTMASLFDESSDSINNNNNSDTNSTSSSTSTTESFIVDSDIFGSEFGAGFSMLNDLNLTEPTTTTTTTTTTLEPTTSTTEVDGGNKSDEIMPMSSLDPSMELAKLSEKSETSTTVNGNSDDKQPVGEATTLSAVVTAVDEQVEAKTKEPDQFGESMAGSTETPSSVPSEAPKSSAGSQAEPHYGKYVGLTTFFLIFIAYLICARAYRRQGMYELNDSNPSLATST